jgi:hypothetical protein
MRLIQTRQNALVSGAAVLLLLALASPAPAKALEAPPLGAFLLKAGEMRGFTPGKARVFRTVAAVETASGEKPTELETKRYEAEGFVEAATVRMHSKTEPAAKGISSVFAFETEIDARAELKAELNEQIDPVSLRKKGILDYLVLKRFKISRVPGAVAFAFLPNRRAKRAGAEVGVAKALFVEGACLIAVAVARFESEEVVEPVTDGVQAVFSRTDGVCSYPSL